MLFFGETENLICCRKKLMSGYYLKERFNIVFIAIASISHTTLICILIDSRGTKSFNDARVSI